jgi:hypothetical protein
MYKVAQYGLVFDKERLEKLFNVLNIAKRVTGHWTSSFSSTIYSLHSGIHSYYLQYVRWTDVFQGCQKWRENGNLPRTMAVLFSTTAILTNAWRQQKTNWDQPWKNGGTWPGGGTTFMEDFLWKECLLSIFSLCSNKRLLWSSFRNNTY